MIRCVVFDFDGTLVRSNEIKRRAYFAAVAELDCPAELVEAFLATPGLGNRFGIIEALLEEIERQHGLPDSRSKSAWAGHIADRYGAICEAEIAVCPEIPGAGTALTRLAGDGCRLYVNSATPGPQLSVLLARRRFEPHLAGAFGSEHGKTENLLHILKTEQLAPSALAVVGDGEDDRVAAAETGCRFVAVEDPMAAGASRFTVQPRQVVSDLHGLPEIIAELGAEDAGRHSLGRHFP